MEIAQRSTDAAPREAGTKRRRSEQDLYAGERLRMARQLAGCSQQQLGDALGVSFQAVQKYETGENRLSAGRLVRAATFLGVDLGFFAKDFAPQADQAGRSTGFTADELELVRAYRALRSEPLRTQLRRLLVTLAERAGASETDGR
jgi:transcriptional regulator with XRE-family HTH domain